MTEERKALTNENLETIGWLINELTHKAYMKVYKGKQEHDIFALRDNFIENIVRSGYKVEVEEIRHIGTDIWYPYYKVVNV